MAMLGGIIIPNVPPAATEPAANFLSYPLLIISGTATIPTTATVTGLEPETAAKPADEPIPLTARLPGSL